MRISRRRVIWVLLIALCLCVFAVIFLLRRGATRTDLRALAPAETLVYLETNDLGETLESLTEGDAWKTLAAGKADFSPLKNVQAAVAVGGFEASERQLTAGEAILNFKPKFVLVGDTHAWESTALSIVENQIGKFARENYGGGDVKLEKGEKRGAKVFVWAAADGRKFYAAVSKSVIYAGNDEALLDKCLAVRQGEAESLLKNENLRLARERAGAENALAFGHVSPEGVAQLAEVAGISMAVAASEENAPRSLIARILPDVLRKTTREISWTARRTGRGGIEDVISVRAEAEVAAVFRETLAPAAENQFPAKAEFLPPRFESATRYGLKNPQLAWRSVLLVASRQLAADAVASRLLVPFSNSFFEPYGVADGEAFLSSVGPEIVTARFDEAGEKVVVIASVKDAGRVRQAISPAVNFKAGAEKISNADVWQSEDRTLAAAFAEDKIILGDRESVLGCLRAKEDGKNFARTVQFQNMPKDSAPAAAVTIARDADSALKIVKVLGKAKEEKIVYTGFYTVETRFGENNFERRTVSDFGLLGTIVEKLGGSAD